MVFFINPSLPNVTEVSKRDTSLQGQFKPGRKEAELKTECLVACARRGMGQTEGSECGGADRKSGVLHC